MALRLAKALRASSEELFELIHDPATEVLRNLLKNPDLTEEHLLALLKRTDLSEELLQAIHNLQKPEKSHRLRLAMARNPATPAPVVITIMPHLYLFELLDLCILPGVPPDQRLAAERQITQRLPEIPLGNKLTLARRAPPGLLGALLREGEPRIVQTCLDNPRLPESALHLYLRSGKPTPDSLSQIARHRRWGTYPRVRLAILKHPRTPAIWFTLWLKNIPVGELRGLAMKRNLGQAQRNVIQDEMKRRGLR
ncbi:MAG: hypothetical protein C0616_05190 [Desulfuromonas sp.]|nr:MAG: hypothetical protein C0616_05190 [Desulfuromonas sp.]